MASAPVTPAPATSSPITTTTGRAPLRRREQQKEQTRLDLALAAFELAREHGLAQVRVPQIAEAVGVSPRTFNNYFASKEAAIVWPNTLRGVRLADDLAARPADEPLADALVATVAGLYQPGRPDELPEGWLDGYRALAAAEPSLHGEHLKAMAAAERSLAEAIARRNGSASDALEPMVLAAVVVAAERAAVLHWFRHSSSGSAPALVDQVRAAVAMAVRGMAVRGMATDDRPPAAKQKNRRT
jgi:AcrR family transcriptional regulator